MKFKDFAIAAMTVIALSLLAGCGGGGGGATAPAADTTKPVFAGAAVTGETIVLTYGEALDGVNIPAASAFTVRVGGLVVRLAETNPVIVSSVNKTVTLTLAAAVYSTDTVTVVYTDPTAADDPNAIQDTAGNDVASLGEQGVTNQAPPNAKGFWGGTTGTVTASAIVLANGDTWVVLLDSGAITRFARLQIQAVGSNYSSTGSQYLLLTEATEPASATGTFTEKTTLSSVIVADSSTTTLASLAYNTRYETPATQGDAAGTWTGSFGGNSSTRTLAVDVTGLMTGSSTTGCSYTGSVQPRPADPAVFDVSFTEKCLLGSDTVLTGIATVNAAKTSMSMAVTTADKTTGALFVGQKL